ncbi:MAG: PspC domain-containing protein [candidate division Zixibacteria bacterium]|nr:PspC domain-containing protein [candidate division Zixibacteria bacterium]MCI0595041.1 PspC domain-containing protein [candidate division Zixibacteria bacterium]
MRKLYRSRKDAKLAGVLGGLAEHLGVDSTLIRLVFVVMAIASFGLMALLYLVAIFIFPKEPQGSVQTGT